MSKTGVYLSQLAVAAAFFWCATPTMHALADNTAICVERMSAYVAELDHLLSTRVTWITPYDNLNGRYFPFGDCDTDPLLVETTKSLFFRGITYFPKSKRYFIEFASKDVEVGFAYLANERRSENHNVGLVNK